MENSEVKELINTFIGYREMLIPIQREVGDFVDTFKNLQDDLKEIDKAFSGDVTGKLSEIYKILENQAEKSENLTKKVDQFLISSTKFTDGIDKLISTFENIQTEIDSINNIEQKAEEQLSKLDVVLEEKKKTYNIKELQKSLETYNENLSGIANFINNDIVSSMSSNSETISEIKNSNETILKSLSEEQSDIVKLSENYKITNALLKKIIEKEDVNEEYIFDILDKWAETRGVKKKK